MILPFYYLNLIINNPKKLEGLISIPGDKSITHRAIMLGLFLLCCDISKINLWKLILLVSILIKIILGLIFIIVLAAKARGVM